MKNWYNKNEREIKIRTRRKSLAHFYCILWAIKMIKYFSDLINSSLLLLLILLIFIVFFLLVLRKNFFALFLGGFYLFYYGCPRFKGKKKSYRSLIQFIVRFFFGCNPFGSRASCAWVLFLARMEWDKRVRLLLVNLLDWPWLT